VCVRLCLWARSDVVSGFFPFVSHWTDANSRDSLGFFWQWFVCMCFLRGCLFAVDLLDVSVEMRGVSEQGLHLVIRRSFVSDWVFAFILRHFQVFSLWSKHVLFGLYGFVWEKGCRTGVVLRSFDMGAWHGCCHSGMAYL
jgi:hypothetical protein